MACLFKRAIFGHAQAHSSNTGSGGEQSVGCGTSAENNANCGWETPGDGPADKTLQHVASVSHSRSGLCEKLHFLCFLLLSNSHAGKWVTFIFYHRNSKLTARLRRLSCVLPFLSTACSQNTGRLSTRSQDFTCFSRQKPVVTVRYFVFAVVTAPYKKPFCWSRLQSRAQVLVWCLGPHRFQNFTWLLTFCMQNVSK